MVLLLRINRHLRLLAAAAENTQIERSATSWGPQAGLSGGMAPQAGGGNAAAAGVQAPVKPYMEHPLTAPKEPSLVGVHVCACVQACVCGWVHACAHTYMCVRAHVRACAHACMHAHMCAVLGAQAIPGGCTQQCRS